MTTDRRTARQAAADSCGIDGLDHVHVGLCNGLGFDAGVAWGRAEVVQAVEAVLDEKPCVHRPDVRCMCRINRVRAVLAKHAEPQP